MLLLRRSSFRPLLILTLAASIRLSSAGRYTHNGAVIDYSTQCGFNQTDAPVTNCCRDDPSSGWTGDKCGVNQGSCQDSFTDCLDGLWCRPDVSYGPIGSPVTTWTGDTNTCLAKDGNLYKPDYDTCVEIGFVYQGSYVYTGLTDSEGECFDLCKADRDCTVATWHHGESEVAVSEGRAKLCELQGRPLQLRTLKTQTATWHKECGKTANFSDFEHHFN